MREEVANLRAERPPPGMVEVRYAGVSGMLRQAREDAQRDEHGNLVPRHIVSLDKPRPASGAAAMLWDAMAAVRKRKEERAAAGLLPLSGRC
jgi:hypothetical protein